MVMAVLIITTNDQVQKILRSSSSSDNAFAIGNLGDIIRKHRHWQEYFPRVEPFYAIKCNDVEPVIRILADMGLSFDCASKIEIQKILDLGVDPSRIIYANTFKQPSFLKFAAENCVSLMTFDCEDELTKIKKVYPEAKLVLRISPQSNYKVKFHLGRKFGCHPLRASELLQVAMKLKLNVIGVSFHVGSGCLETGAFEAAIEQSRKVFDIGLAMGFNMHLLDIGGGFPGQKIQNVETNITFEEIARVANKSLDKYFPGNDVRIIAEPGQYYVASAFTVAVNIITKKIVMDDEIVQPNSTECVDDPTTQNEPVRMYIINDGIYGCFFACFVDPRCYVPSHFKSIDEELYNSTIWGPTCDALDLIIDNVKLPELSTGDWIYFKDMGAYSFPNISSFNNMPRVKEFYICERKLWEEIYQP
ncbi:ornithine decarboxylase-like [Mytilus californianus]|uniref:ornithine decarboxylase-like n=1 Tax=Mytilus californianus TaxID=6549 RepID=UPI0022486B72|nr:ornithine decarboxylase-like [Mytilus californianus]